MGGTDSALPGPNAGRYALALSRVLYRERPILFDAQVEIEGAGLSMTLQPLAAADRTTPVGVPARGGPFPLESSGLYVAEFDFDIPGEAIPWPLAELPPGSLVELELQLAAQEPTCGLAGGIMLQPNGFPEDMAGATFALQSAAQADAYILPVIDCAGAKAEPL
jgi:hypothetical protein